MNAVEKLLSENPVFRNFYGFMNFNFVTPGWVVEFNFRCP